jgi:hypothetical protein
MKRMTIVALLLLLFMACKKNTRTISNPAELSTTAPSPGGGGVEVGPPFVPPCPNSFEPQNNTFPGVLINSQPQPGIECQYVSTQYLAGIDADKWRINGFGGCRAIFIAPFTNSLIAPIFRVIIRGLDGTVLVNAICNAKTGAINIIYKDNEWYSIGYCNDAAAGCDYTSGFDCITKAHFTFSHFDLSKIVLELYNNSPYVPFCYDLGVQYVCV